MNFFKKLYCRGVQGAFRLLLPFLPYRTPRILRSTEEIPRELRRSGVSSALIVTGPRLRARGAIEPLCRALYRAGIRYTVYDSTKTNPTVQNVEEATKLYLSEGCNGIIAFGGGSPMDCAKIVGARIARPKKSVAQMKGVLRICKRTPYFMAIPTTAGSGSEVTLAAVITNEQTHHKFPISDFVLIPDSAVLDGENTRTLPKFFTATTGMDALTHAIEAYIGRSTTKQSRADALHAVRLIFEHLERAAEDGEDMEARAAMQEAAFYAGRAFSVSYVGYCHAVAHTLGGKYDIPHGLANAVLLPHVLRAYGKAAHKKLKRLAVAAGIATEADAPGAAAERLIHQILQMNQRMGIPAAFSEILREDIPTLAKYAEREANPLYPVPVLMTAVELEKLYFDVMEKSSDQ